MREELRLMDRRTEIVSPLQREFSADEKDEEKSDEEKIIFS